MKPGDRVKLKYRPDVTGIITQIVSNYATVFYDGDYIPSSDEHLTWDLELLNKTNQCECGCSSIGIEFHAHWCPLYEKP